MKRLYIFTLCSVCLATAIFFLKKRNPTTIAAGDGLVIPVQWLHTNLQPRTPKADVRLPDQTFLTFPEWFLVFSPGEQADYFKNHTSTSFPFMAHTAQIWQSYKIVDNQVRNNFPVNKGYHFMIWVIGSSASAEYSIKAFYETVIGRLTDTYVPLTAEDQFNARFADSYVRFIKDRPWYEYDFKSRLSELWAEVPLSGDHLARKAERRYILTSELLVKYIYGKLIGIGTHQVYDVALDNTAVVLQNDSLINQPRYDKFAPAATALAAKGFRFKEIAGNNSAILLTVLVPSQTVFTTDSTTCILFSQPVASDTATKRVALVTTVPNLSNELLKLKHDNIFVEHVFDY